ncbi:hypothetical protein [Zooshikella harenae]|uniref:Secreted protein n=1 Tax=Zooshikella harenae TaxID=2827238 RepID=A0ABS5ZES0_9GAMM|nr:hypothetical protein [Zooshikella harenae]MBU2712567.1 hypothetical protein [Zooshikella harenae]
MNKQHCVPPVLCYGFCLIISMSWLCSGNLSAAEELQTNSSSVNPSSENQDKALWSTQQLDELVLDIEQSINQLQYSIDQTNSTIIKLETLRRLQPVHPKLSILERRLAQTLSFWAVRFYNQLDYKNALHFAGLAKNIVPNQAEANQVIKLVAIAQQQRAEKIKRATAAMPSVPRVHQSKVQEREKAFLEHLNSDQRAILEELPQDAQAELINIIILDQQQISERLFDIRHVLDSVVDQMIKENARAVMTSQSDSDARWIMALMKTRIRQINPYFELNLKKRISPGMRPNIALYAQ